MSADSSVVLWCFCFMFFYCAQEGVLVEGASRESVNLELWISYRRPPRFDLIFPFALKPPGVPRLQFAEFPARSIVFEPAP